MRKRLIAAVAAGAMAVSGVAAVSAGAGSPEEACVNELEGTIEDEFGSLANAVAAFNEASPPLFGTLTVGELENIIEDICD